jgi:3',5'-cyclic-AMP phosphodiesterase
MKRPQFQPIAPDAAGVVSWIHYGDLHMQLAGDQNYEDLVELVQKVNATFADAISFVMLPGDNANEGSKAQYEVVRSALDRLKAPWCAIVGDHDVHEKSLKNFLEYMQPETHFDFTLGKLHFFALNAFSTPFPESFELSDDQLDGLEAALEKLPANAHAVLFLHCYPSELNQGGDRLRRIIKGRRVLLIDMGHTHYNEVANDWNTLYTATRSTGQIEEGPVGFSVTNIDGDCVSWKFMPLDRKRLVMITSPADRRLMTAATTPTKGGTTVTIRAKVWAAGPQTQVLGEFAGEKFALSRIDGSNVFQATLAHAIEEGVYELIVTAFGEGEETAHDKIQVRVGDGEQSKPRPPHDVENVLDAWPDHGLFGTRLGPNRNGRKW